MQTFAFRLCLLLLACGLIGSALWGCDSNDDDDDSGAGPTDDDAADDDASTDDDDDDNDDDNDNNDDNDNDDNDNDTGPEPLDDGSFTDDSTPFVSGLDGRIATLLDDCAAEGLGSGSINAQVCVLATGAGAVSDAAIAAALSRVDAREDCADFGVASLVRILAKYGDDPNLSPAQYDTIVASLLNFSYWVDEPGNDAMNYQTENHHILFNSAAFVMGDLFPDAIFTNSGMTGAQLRAKARFYIDRWLEFRLRFGFTEFHSDVYYNEDIPALANLSDFGNDEDIQLRARMALDVMLLDMALNNHEGVFGVAHGRTYMKDKQRLETEDTKTTIWLMFGKGDTYGDNDSMSAVALADSDLYRLPAVVEAVGSARPRGLVSKEKISLNVADGPAHGIGYDNYDDVLYWWSMNGFVAPEAIETTFAMFEEWGLLAAPSPFAAFALVKPLNDLGILDDLMWGLFPLACGNSIQQANTYVYRTPEVMLASAQDYWKGMLGAQTHVWQATLGWEALLFTTYPGGFVENEFAGDWTGGWHPRVAQYRTAAIILYRKPELDLALVQPIVDLLLPNYTHAFIPTEAFDEVVQQDDWTFVRYGDGYAALYSYNPTEWRTEGEWAGKELVADGAENVWICEVGDATLYGDFDTFQQLVAAARVEIEPATQQVLYESPGQGRLVYSWDGDFIVRGATISQADYGRFANPFIEKNWDDTDPYVVERGALKLTDDPENLIREIVE
ncbi:MAG: hypothetical protein GX444_04680 [Myxococcales bacterium]|nr:hypothetical protein [Myxococcales bacterium]